MTTITKERLLTIKQWRETYGPGSNVVLPAEEAEELARIALVSLEAGPVAVSDDMAYAFHHALSDSSLGTDEVEEIKVGLRAAFANVTAQPVPVVPGEIADDLMEKLPKSDAWANGFRGGWNACRAVMLQSGNFREIAETSTNSPVIPSEVLSAILKFARVRADFDDFDGDRRGIGDCLDETEHEPIVTINKYASQLAVVLVGLDERAAFNAWNNEENLPIVGVSAKNAAWLAWQARAELGRSLAVNSPVTPDGWISCSERMPNDGQHVIILCDGAFVLYAQYRDGEFFDVVRNGEEFFETQSRNVTHWMPLPEPPQEVNRG
ncbi:TPA: DUF551 domain-containing protein [Escherichia coli]|nr:DUF551 domain-containing protein [Escherichia coli]